jgi:calcineurin-like phosphoesterase family protein
VAFGDTNANGQHDADEAGLPGVVVTDGTTLAATDATGAYALPGVTAREVFVITPGDRSAVGSWHRAAAARVDFPLAPAPVGSRWRFAHLSDPHVNTANVARFRAALARAAAARPDLALVSGDLVYDAMRADARTARRRFDAYDAVVTASPIPVRPAIGNHDVLGIDRERSGVALGSPGYGKGLYEEREGPRYSAFNRGAVHFLMLDTIGISDTWCFGLVDEAQLEWIRREVRYLPAGATVVTVGHIPLRSAILVLGYAAEGLAKTFLSFEGRTSYPHLVSNAEALAQILKPYRWTLALQGHTHIAEKLPAVPGSRTRYHTAPAATRREEGKLPPGFVLYAVDGADVDDGELISLD